MSMRNIDIRIQKFLQVGMIIFILLLSSEISFSQDLQNIRTVRKHALSYKAGGDFSVVGLSYDYFETPKINFELNLSIAAPGIGGGIYYHPWGHIIENNWSPYTGVHVGSNLIFWDDVFSVYIPVGVNYTGANGFNFNIDVGCIIDGIYFSDRLVDPWASIKIGYRFYNGDDPSRMRKSDKKRLQRTQSLRKERKLGLAVMAKWPNHYLGLNIDYFILPQLNAEIFASYKEKGFGVGLSYHPIGNQIKSHFSPYVGFVFAMNMEHYQDSWYFPVGINYISEFGPFISIDLGYNYVARYNQHTNEKVRSFMLGASIKAGYRF